MQEQIYNLKAENERLKEEVEIRDNLVEHFRKEAINWAKISNDCIKDIENYKQTLQEIKAIAEECTTCGDCFNCKYTEHCSTDIEAQALGVCRMILKLITKAEEE